MIKNSAVMYYLESLISEEYKNSACGDEKIFLIKDDNNSLEAILAKKIAIIKKIRELACRDDSSATKLVIGAKFFSPFVDEGVNLSKVYVEVLRSQQGYSKNSCSKDDEKADIAIAIADKMILAALLEVAIFKDKYTYSVAQEVLNQHLYDVSGYDSKLEFVIPPKPGPLDGNVRKFTTYSNFARLTLNRLRRLLFQFAKLLEAWKEYVNGLQLVETYGTYNFFRFVNWIFFIPRLSINIKDAFVSIFYFNQLEKELGWYRRLRAQISNTWAQLANDVAWISNGIFACFFLAGMVPAVGVSLMLLAQVYDFILICIRNYVEVSRLRRLESQIQSLPDAVQDKQVFLLNIQNRMQFEKKVLFYFMSNFVILLICVTFMMPFFVSVSPVIPVVFGIISVLTGIYHARNTYFFEEIERPKLYGGILLPTDDYGVVTIKNNNHKEDKWSLGHYYKGFVLYDDHSTLYFYNKDASGKITKNKVDIDINEYKNLVSDSQSIESLPKTKFDAICDLIKNNKLLPTANNDNNSQKTDTINRSGSALIFA